MLRAVLFDLFGTVIAYDDIAEGTRLGWDAVYDTLLPLGLTAPRAVFVANMQQHFETPLDAADDCDPSLFVGKLLRLQRQYGLAQDRTAAWAAAEACLQNWGTHISVPDDAVATFAALRATHKLALVTNFDHPSFVRALLERHDLARWFDVITISAELRIDKPDPRIFWQALDALGVPPAEALMVGDSVHADIGGAQAAGCQAVLIDRLGWHPDYDGARIQTLSELVALAR